jgi:uncharacterized membrane protein
MKKQILYLGDTAIDQAACYLAGVMTNDHITFDYLPSDAKFSTNQFEADYQAVIISDYPSANFTAAQLALLAKRVQAGMGLLMLGGWESYTGLNREYTDTVLKDVLPVVMQPTDDRTNSPQPCLVEKIRDHEILGNLPFDACTPGIGGFNKFQAKTDGEVLLNARRFKVWRENGEFKFQPSDETIPLLVIGSYGRGRVACFASDVAPHWVGGLVDWGDGRVKAKAIGSVDIEVGNWYARFFANLVRWVANLR